MVHNALKRLVYWTILVFSFAPPANSLSPVKAPLSLRQIPIFKSTRDDSRSWTIKKVCVCGGNAVHGFALEMEDGSRRGCLQDNSHNSLSLSDRTLAQRGGCWIPIGKAGVVNVSGYNLSRKAPPYLCHTLRLTLRSGETIEYEGTDDGWRGEPFSCDIAMANDDDSTLGGLYLLDFLKGCCTSVYSVQLHPFRHNTGRKLALPTLSPLLLPVRCDSLQRKTISVRS